MRIISQNGLPDIVNGVDRRWRYDRRYYILLK